MTHRHEKFFTGLFFIVILFLAFTAICYIVNQDKHTQEIKTYQITTEEINGYKILIITDNAPRASWGYAVVLEHPLISPDLSEFDTIPMKISPSSLMPPEVELPNDND